MEIQRDQPANVDREVNMIGAHQTDAWLSRLDATLPAEITDASWAQPMPKSFLIGTIRTQLLPFITGGPTYRRAVDDNLSRAIAAYRREDGQAFLLWLGDAVDAAALQAPRRTA